MPGLLTVVKDLRLKEPYTGIVQLHTGEIAEDLAFYLTDSEQVPSAVGLGVLVEPRGGVFAAGGFLIQAFPPYDDRTVDGIIEGIRKAPSIAESVLNGKRPEELLEIFLGGLSFEILAMQALSFRCSCGKERVEQALVALGREEIADLIAEQGEVDVTCEFCKKAYHLSREELERLATVM